MSAWDDETAEWYAEKYGEYATNKLGIECLRLDPKATVVDIGCGTGSALRYAAEKVTDGSLIGIDPVPRMVEIAKEKTKNHQAAKQFLYYEGGAEDLPIEDHIADVVLAFDSFDHWVDQIKGLQEVRRVIKTDGQFVIVKDGGLPKSANAKNEFLSVINESGFKVLKEHTIKKDGVRFTQWVCIVEN